MAGDFIAKALSYGAALVRWRKAGKPVRSEAEQKLILETICQPCQFFRPNGPRCELCGCGLKLGGDKLRWQTESCPLTPPRWGPDEIMEECKPLSKREARRQSREDRKLAREARGAKKAAERIALGGIMPASVEITPVEDPLVLCDRQSKPIGHALRGMWQGTAAFFVCGGPSLKKLDLSFLKERGIVSMGLNNVAGYAPVRAMTFSDPASKFHHGIFFDPAIIKFVPRPKLSERVRAKLPDGTFQWTAHQVKSCPSVFGYERDGIWNPAEFLTREKATWGVSKKHKENEGKPTILFSFFLGIRLLHYLGVRRIYLLGVDFKMDAQNHYAFGQYRHEGAISGNNNSYRVATNMLMELRPHLEAAGLEIFQTNKDSALRVFDHCELPTAIEDCRGLVPKEPFCLDRFYEKNTDGPNPAKAPDGTDDRGE